MRKYAVALVLSVAAVAWAQFEPPAAPPLISGASVGPGCTVTATGLSCTSLKVDVLDAGVALVNGQTQTLGRIEAADVINAALDVQVPQGRAFYVNGPTRSIGFSYDGTNLKVLGNAALTPNSDQAINFGASGVRWSNGYFGGPIAIAGRDVPTAAPNDGGATSVYIEYGRDVLGGTTKAVLFKNAFALAPSCRCTDDTAIAACDVSVTSTSGATFNGTSGDKFHWECTGDR